MNIHSDLWSFVPDKDLLCSILLRSQDSLLMRSDHKLLLLNSRLLLTNHNLLLGSNNHLEIIPEFSSIFNQSVKPVGQRWRLQGGSQSVDLDSDP